jgi:hypothetical protein
MNIYIRIVETQCSLGTLFISGICVDTLNKGDTDDDDDDDKQRLINDIKGNI